MKIIAYTYEADIHCCSCAEARFGTQDGRDWVSEDAEDGEGNPVHPVFSTDELEDDEVCGTCVVEL